MELTIASEAPPLRREGSGVLRVGASRVLVELLVRAFQDGSTPEAIAQRYPTVMLADTYAVIAYYLRHRDELEAYLEDREQQAGAVRQRIEAGQGTLVGVRERLLIRRAGCCERADPVDARPSDHASLRIREGCGWPADAGHLRGARSGGSATGTRGTAAS